MSARAWIAASTVLVACQQRSAAPVQPVVAAETMNMPITVTDMATREEVPGVRMTKAGQVVPGLPAGRYAFAITTGDRFAFFESEIAASGGLEIAWSSDCHALRGRAKGTIKLPATVILSRFSSATGDVFRVDLAADGSFAACLPAAMYAVHVEGAVVSLTGPLMMPADTVEIAVNEVSEVQQVPQGIKIANADFASFARSLVDRRVIGLGEANHGTAEFYTLRGKLVLELARIGKLRTMLLEIDAIEAMAVGDYVLGADVDIAKAVAALRFWITDVEEFHAVLAELRRYNASVPAADRIHVAGIDAQRIEPPVRFLLAHRQELGIAERDEALLSRVGPDRGKAYLEFSEPERAALLAALQRLAEASGSGAIEQMAIRGAVAARSVRHQLGYVTSASQAGLRDKAMADIAAYLIRASGSAQVAIWAHNAHIAREPDTAERSLGQNLAETFGSSYYPIGFLSYRGAGRAWDKAGKIGVIPQELGPTQPYNVESVVMVATGFPEAAWVRLDNVSAPVARWLAVPRFVREFGAPLDPSELQILRGLPNAFSAVVVIQHTGPTTPTPTGVRKAKP